MNEPVNLSNTAAIIDGAATEILNAEDEMMGAKETIKAAKKRVKAASVSMKAFNTALALLRLDRGKRDETLDGLRICFNALQLGEQGRLFPE